MLIEKKSLLLACVVCAAVVVQTTLRAGDSSASAPTTASAPAAAVFDVPKGGRMLLVPVTHKGKTYQFLLDTALTWSGLDQSFSKELGKPMYIAPTATPSGTIDAALYAPPSGMAFGDLKFSDAGLVICQNLRGFSGLLGKNLDGLIGVTLLKSKVVQIDFDAGKVRLFAPDRSEHAEWGQAFPLKFIRGVPAVRASIGGIEEDFILDTGCDGCGYLTPEVFGKVLAQKKSPTVDILISTAAGTATVREARLGPLNLGTSTYDGLILSEGQQCALGLPFLARHVVTFDFPNSKLYLRKGKDFDVVQERDMSGLRLFRADGKTLVHSLEKDSPAKLSGVQAKDVLLKIGPHDAGKMELFDIQSMLRKGDGLPVTITILRGSEQKTFTFKLKKRI